MSKAATSPTARLLQSSRLFSLPRPLPAPLNDSLTSTGTFKGSDTATLPYPTHQAIITPAAALHRGDYGLKRSLPKRTIRGTSTPHVRIRAQDTYEHITDFASAADHTLSAKKWAEMEVPIFQTPKNTSTQLAPDVSVYEEWVDNTAQQRGGRWKYSGPWLAGMQEGEFSKWLDSTIAKRRDEWKEFLRGKELEKRISEKTRQARDQGDPLSRAAIDRLRVEQRPTDAELLDVEKQLRENLARDRLSSDMTAYVVEFLDLPPVMASDVRTSAHALNAFDLHRGLGSEDEDGMVADGPPTTHPGAGLSHLRTNAIMPNHPVWGPQASAAPVEARVVKPRLSARGGEFKALLGVGGFVAADTETETRSTKATNRSGKYSRAANRAVESLDENVEGGNKLWVQPKRARVNARGRIVLEVERAAEEPLAVKMGGREVEELIEKKTAQALQAESMKRPRRSDAYGLNRTLERSRSRPARSPYGFGLN